MQPDATDPNGYALSPQQEQAAALLASGISVQTVADQLSVHRTTLWHWRNLETFQAYFNALRFDAKQQAAEGIAALQQKAVETLERVMENGSDGAALRAAALVLQTAQARVTGETNPRRLIRDQAAAEADRFMWDALSPGASDHAYQRRCGELGIEP